MKRPPACTFCLFCFILYIHGYSRFTLRPKVECLCIFKSLCREQRRSCNIDVVAMGGFYAISSQPLTNKFYKFFMNSPNFILSQDIYNLENTFNNKEIRQVYCLDGLFHFSSKSVHCKSTNETTSLVNLIKVEILCPNDRGHH